MSECDDEPCPLCGESDQYCDCSKALYECGKNTSGHCTLAGTEHCDFECPLRDMPTNNKQEEA